MLQVPEVIKIKKQFPSGDGRRKISLFIYFDLIYFLIGISKNLYDMSDITRTETIIMRVRTPSLACRMGDVIQIVFSEIRPITNICNK